MVECTGCRKDFSISGYTQHVYRTSDASCITAYVEEMDKQAAALQDAGGEEVKPFGWPGDVDDNGNSYGRDDSNEREVSDEEVSAAEFNSHKDGSIAEVNNRSEDDASNAYLNNHEGESDSESDDLEDEEYDSKLNDSYIDIMDAL